MTLPRAQVERRMAAQRLTGEPLADPEAVVGHLTAVQAQEWAECQWSVAQRTRDADARAVEAAVDAGDVIRTHVLRPTWHLVLREDLRWLTRLTGPRIQRSILGRHRQLGLDEATVKASLLIIERALQDGPQDRRALGAALEHAGIATDGQRLPHLLIEAELELVICSGPRLGRQHGYALVDQVVPDEPPRPRDEALEDLARRWQAARGPATPQDLAWWGGLTLTDARRALDAAGAPPEPPPSTAGVRLVPTYDELWVSHVHADRHAWAADPPDERLFSLLRAVVCDGRTVGTWRRTLTARELVVEAELWVDLPARAQRALEREATRLAACFDDREAVLQVTRR